VSKSYRLYHPKWYRRRMPIFWWLRAWSYTRFITRELTSLAVGYGAVLLLVSIWAVTRSEETYERFSDLVLSTPALVLHLLVLAALLLHTLTWLNLAPRAMALYVGGRRVPDALVLAAHYLAWAAVSVGVVWLLTRGTA